MQTLLDIVDLRRLLLDYLGPIEICDFIESQEEVYQDKIEQDIDYWIKRTKRQYNIPKPEFLHLLNATTNEKRKFQKANNKTPLGNNPSDIFLFLTPGVCWMKNKITLPGCNICNIIYDILHSDLKLLYPLAKYNYKPVCKYIFQRGMKRGIRCENIAVENSQYCRLCFKYPPAR